MSFARPFVGTAPENLTRTGNRHDYAVAAPEKTLVDRAYEEAGGTYAIGKIADIFAHRGITKQYKATGLSALLMRPWRPLKTLGTASLIFTNFVDFDSSYGAPS